MIEKRRLLRNALLSAAQVVVIGATFVVLYRFLRDTIGADDFGVWAVVLATTSLGSIANLGLAASAVKFVSQYLAREDHVRVRHIIQTAALSVGAILAVVLVAAYPLLRMLLGIIIQPEAQLGAALAILPYALAAFWLNAVAGVFQSCLDGFHRIDLRAYLVMGSAVTYVGLCFWMVPRGGLIALAQAQVIQMGLLLLGAWVLLLRQAPGLPWVPLRWRRDVFTEMFGYSVNFSVISLSQMLFEPTAKSLLSRFGGVVMVTDFEFAHRMVVQVRALFATAHQAVVPAIADLQEKDAARVVDLYRTSFRLVLFLVLPSLPLLVALTPVVSRLWIGSYEPYFVLFAALLFGGWFLNMFANPAYFANMGTGHLRWNVWGHLAIGALSLGLGLALGDAFGGTGVVVGYVIALLTGSFLIAWAYQRQHGIHMHELVDAPSVVLGVVSLAAGGGAFWLALRQPTLGSPWLLALLLPAGYLALTALPLWRHPIRAQVQGWLAAFLRRPDASSTRA